ncbi:MAG TPA: HNH endonuclease signature motif containing protein [Pyrinomonadaceae bacterium]|jgi:hypothetical protein
MKLTPSQVKNLMRRGLRFLVDPEPAVEERQRAIAFFGHCCAYCGTPIGHGKGDLDHLVPAAKGGRNHISNRVFSCKPCNAEEKRDKDWEEFLLEKCGGSPTFELRSGKILEWIESAGAVPPLSEDMLHLIEEQCREATAAYDKACRKVRGI